MLLATSLWPAFAASESVPITLAEAIESTTESSPSIAAGEHAVDAAASMVEQAGVLPNPELDIETENFAGSGELSGFDALETTIAVSQRLELGGKRRARRERAQAELAAAEAALALERGEAVARTTGDFYLLLAAQRRLALAVDVQHLSERLLKAVEARVEAGKVSPVERTRSKIPVVMSKAEVAAASRRLEAARVRLAANWGGDLDGRQAAGELESLALPPPLASMLAAAVEGPAIRILNEQVATAAGEVELQRALRVPDLVVGAGSRHFADTDEHAWLAGVNLAIPLFDTNRAARQSSEHELAHHRMKLEAAKNELRAQLSEADARVRAALEEARLIGTEALPAAQSALNAAEIGYVEGKFELLSVLDSQRTFYESQQLYIDALERYHLERAELERLVGRCLSSFDSQSFNRPPSGSGSSS
jgi:cobalt-zinc-cadmium efflux system outer membrane protein